jgi:hypothetical protein
MDSPVLLVEIDQAGKCSLNYEAIQMMKEIDEEVAVVSVAGMYRTGKSYLLNRLMGRQHGFEIGPSVNACTKGIWLWGSPVKFRNKQVLLIDTEGLGSPERDQTIDMIIFSISVLISSTFIYNSMGSIDEQALEDLSLVCKLTQHIHVKSSQSPNLSQSSTMYSQYFPKFIWAIRDFCLQLVDKEGKSISSNQYLEECLSQTTSSSLEGNSKNEIRKILKDFFRERECFTFVRPINKDKKLRNIQEVPFEELRDDFKQQVTNFVSQVLQSTTSKTVEGVAVSGKSLSLLLEQYIDAINRDAVPTISTAWERTIDIQTKEAYRAANNSYKKSIKQLRSELPKEDSDLRALESEARKSGLKIIDKVPVISGLKEETAKVRSKFLDRCDSALETLLSQNFQASRSKASGFLRELFDTMEDKIMTSEKFHWLPEEFSAIFDVSFS